MAAIGLQLGNQHVDSCFLLLGESLRLATRSSDSVGIARAMCAIADSYLFLRKNEAQAVSWVNAAKKVAQKNKDYLHLAKCYELLAIVSFHQRMGNEQELLAIARTYSDKSDNVEVRAGIELVAADFFSLHKNYRQAARHLRKGLTLYEKRDPDKWLSSGLDYCDLLLKQGKKKEAVVMAQRLASVRPRLTQSDGLFVYTNDLARLSVLLRHYREAEAILMKGINWEQKRAHPDSLHLYYYYKTLVKLYADEKDFEKAYRYSEEVANIRVWLQQVRLGRDVKVQMTELKAALNLAKKERELSLVSARHQRQRLYLFGTLLMAALLIGLMLLLQRNHRHIKRQHRQLAELNLSKNKLFAMLAHDLRSPITSLSNSLNLINWGTLSQQEFSGTLPGLSMQLHTVQTTLDNLLNWSLSQLDGLLPRLEPVVVSETVDSQIRLLQIMAKSKSIGVSNQIPPQVRLQADADHLAIILRNLLHNALKFTQPSGNVRIVYQEGAGVGWIEVIDDGVGIPQNQLATLFDIKYRSSSQGTQNEAGSGLGLVLVYELVKVNGGFIEAKSSSGKGTIFSLMLPLVDREKGSLMNPL